LENTVQAYRASVTERIPEDISGLTSREAEQALVQYGPNDPTPTRRHSRIRELLLLFLNPLIIILVIAGVVSAFLGELISAGIIIAMVLLGIAINFVQTYRSQRAVEQLRKHVMPTATALRDRQWQDIHREDVVPGDVIRLSAGDLVPADARLLASRDLFVQQAALTGESLAVEKEAGAVEAQPTGQPEGRNLVFFGTSVVSGTATALVSATGRATAFGAIAERLAMRPPETEFERGLRHFGQLIMRTTFLLVLFIVVVRIALHKDAFESLVFAVALAVGLTPEFLPMITSVTLARGAVRMAKAHVVVKHLSAIQNLGSIDVLCSDKTGTLTLAEMTLQDTVDPFGRFSERPFTLAYLNSAFETGIRSPLDAAILAHGSLNISDYQKRDEIPFDFERRRLSIVVETRREDRPIWMLITKGSPEGMIETSNFCEVDGQTIALDLEGRKRCHATGDGLSNQGFRVLGVAYRALDSCNALSVKDESELVFAGFLAFADPLRLEAKAALAALHRDGVELKVLTGDNELVARHICQQAGIEESSIVLGAELEKMSDTALGHVAEQTTLFARVSPMQKHRIILALKRRSHVVGFIGDGINDAPSLHAADVGISVASAVDVARDAADIILLEPGFQVLHNGIIEGRKASANVLKYLLMGTSSNFGNMFSMAVASLFLPFLPMLPTQILLNNFLYDLAQITIPTDNVDKVYLRRPQRWNIHLVRDFMIFIGPISSIYDFLTFLVLLYFFHAGEQLFHTGWFVESLATQTLVLFVIRTMGNPLRSRPSAPLAASAIAIVLVGLAIPFSSLGGFLGFTPLPKLYFTFLAIAAATYLLLVNVVKRRLFKHSRPPLGRYAVREFTSLRD
jgi:P-type Mg2+ transporter